MWFQGKLQEDFDTVQAMLEEKQKEIESLTQELADIRPLGDGITAETQVTEKPNENNYIKSHRNLL